MNNFLEAHFPSQHLETALCVSTSTSIPFDIGGLLLEKLEIQPHTAEAQALQGPCDNINALFHAFVTTKEIIRIEKLEFDRDYPLGAELRITLQQDQNEKKAKLRNQDATISMAELLRDTLSKSGACENFSKTLPNTLQALGESGAFSKRPIIFTTAKQLGQHLISYIAEHRSSYYNINKEYLDNLPEEWAQQLSHYPAELPDCSNLIKGKKKAGINKNQLPRIQGALDAFHEQILRIQGEAELHIQPQLQQRILELLRTRYKEINPDGTDESLHSVYCPRLGCSTLSNAIENALQSTTTDNPSLETTLTHFTYEDREYNVEPLLSTEECTQITLLYQQLIEHKANELASAEKLYRKYITYK